MAGFNGTTMFANNVDFSGDKGNTPAITTNGQLLIGSTTFPNIRPGTLTSSDGSAIISYVSPNINITSGLGLGRFPITPYVVGQVGNAGYQTIQSAVNAANAAGGGLVYVQEGSYTENLTLYPNVNIQGAVGATTITGVHTPPTTGTITFDYLVLVSATDIFNSSAAGTASININNSFIIITNGYIFNLLNWTGELLMDNCGEASTNDGVVNNTGGSQIKFINVEIGAGSGKTMTLTGNGNVRFDTCNINCPTNIAGSGTFIFQNGVKIANTLTIGGSKSGQITELAFITGANTPFIFNSSGSCSLESVSFDTSANPAISGTGSGTLNLSNITFINSDIIANTLTLGSGGGLYPPGSLGTAGFVWTSNGPGVCPTFKASSASGTVSTVSVVSANGFAGTVANPTTTPAITLTTTATGVLSGNGTSISGSPITQFDVLVGGASNAVGSVGPGTAGQLLQSGGNAANPAYTTSTYPSTNAANTILYASSANTMAALPTANNGTLITSNTGVPSWLANSGTAGWVFTANTGAPPSWQPSPASSISITGDSGGALTGNSFTFTGGSTGLTFAGAGTTETLGGIVNLAHGGTNANLTASNGGIFYSTGSAGAILAGTAIAGQLLTSGASTTPAWTTSTYPLTNAANTILYASSANTMAALATANDGVLVTSNSGVPSWLANSGTPGYVLTANTGAPPSWQAAAGSGIVTIDGDTGSATGTTISLFANPSSGAGAGSSVYFNATGSTIDMATTDANASTFIGLTVGNRTHTGLHNAAFGFNNSAMLTTGASNNIFGVNTAGSLQSGSFNNIFGGDTASSLISGNNNIIIGENTAISITSGSYNIILGNLSGGQYVTTESSNILISNIGVATESNTIRIGTQGTGNNQQNACYIAGIEGVTVSNLNIVTINTSTGQLGSEASFGTANGGTGLTATPGNSTLLATNSSGTLAYRAFSINTQTFTSSGTYTPSTGMLYCIIEVVGGGGGGGGAAGGSTGYAAGGGGGYGGYAKRHVSAATLGSSQTVTIGAAGSAGAAGNNAGGTGGTTSVGSLISATGGVGGSGSANSGTSTSTVIPGGAGGIGSSGDLNSSGAPGGFGQTVFVASSFSNTVSGGGASGIYGAGAQPVYLNNVAGSTAGNAGILYGGGGSGATVASNSSAAAGGAGAKGYVFITEYIIN